MCKAFVTNFRYSIIGNVVPKILSGLLRYTAVWLSINRKEWPGREVVAWGRGGGGGEGGSLVKMYSPNLFQ